MWLMLQAIAAIVWLHTIGGLSSGNGKQGCFEVCSCSDMMLRLPVCPFPFGKDRGKERKGRSREGEKGKEQM